MMKSLFTVLPLLLLLLISCKRDDPEPQLPPATQTGERTFGALVNGKVWIPKGRPDFFTPPLSVIYDPGYAGGTLRIRAYRKLNDSQEYIQMSMTEVDDEGSYLFDDSGRGGLIFEKDCDLHGTDDDVLQNGTLIITRLDIESRIISGTFEFTLAKPDCDTIRVTDGRFDYRL